MAKKPAKKAQTKGAPKRKSPQFRTPRWRAKFLDMMSKTGNVKLSCMAARVSRHAVYKARTDHPDFADQWDDARDDFGDMVFAEVVSRAIKGVQEPSFHGPTIRGYLTKKSDRLLSLLIMALKPEEFRSGFDLVKLLEVLSKRTDS